MEREQSKMRVLMLPWLAHGHISPYLELAKKIANRDFAIYLCSTPINLTSIAHKIPEKLSLSIKLVEIHLQSTPELPPHHHTTNGLPPHLIPTLQSSFNSETPQISTIIETITPDLLIYDFNPPWIPTIAAEYNIPAVQFLTNGATVISFSVHGYVKPGIEFPFPEVKLRGFHEIKLHQKVLEFIKERSRQKSPGDGEALKKSSKTLLLNTFRELEGKYIDYISVLTGKIVVPVGPLVQEIANEKEETEVMKWIDKKNDSSTVFVSFGSEYFLSKDEIEEVAHGLELSGVNFIWVVRFAAGEKTRVEEALPEGFLERVGERGMVVEGWAPQAQILAHSSTGGFVSHCGWNSILESLKFGVPIVAVPMHLDQPMNAKMVEEVGVGVEVQREEDGKFNRDEIAKIIRKVVVDESGEGIRVKARELSENINFQGEEGIDELVQLCKDKLFVQN